MHSIPDLIAGGAGWRQTARLLTLTTPLGPDTLLAETATIDEALGPLAEHAGFRIELTARLDTTATRSASRDYRSLATRPQTADGAIAAAAGTATVATDDPGPYAWQTAADGERMIRRQREAIDARLRRMLGEGTVRGAAPGTTFELGDHARHAGTDSKQRRFLITASGLGGYNQLVFDDTCLQLGHLKQQSGNARDASRGHGAELATRAAIATRAGRGRLEPRHRKPRHATRQPAPASTSSPRRRGRISGSRAGTSSFTDPHSRPSRPPPQIRRPAARFMRRSRPRPQPTCGSIAAK